jgi:hypothetical protein
MPKGVYKKTKEHLIKFLESGKKTRIKKGQHLSEKTEIKKGQRISIETEIKKGQYSGKKNNFYRGKKNSTWKGGVTPKNKIIRKSLEYKLWRNAVFERDNWTCQKYKIRGGKLHPHHIKNFSEFPELRFAIDNGITLSERAHKEFHIKYGVKNNTLEQIIKFLK